MQVAVEQSAERRPLQAGDTVALHQVEVWPEDQPPPQLTLGERRPDPREMFQCNHFFSETHYRGGAELPPYMVYEESIFRRWLKKKAAGGAPCEPGGAAAKALFFRYPLNMNSNGEVKAQADRGMDTSDVAAWLDGPPEADEGRWVVEKKRLVWRGDKKTDASHEGTVRCARSGEGTTALAGGMLTVCTQAAPSKPEAPPSPEREGAAWVKLESLEEKDTDDPCGTWDEVSKTPTLRRLWRCADGPLQAARQRQTGQETGADRREGRRGKLFPLALPHPGFRLTQVA